ncbi:serine hydrolase domain-containing protein [Actinoplanes sp. NPDC051343]|uniref:serine hydrolase domain-containing protein n=1 Tax=Actinoplanes sp. NPDC051343 TaxID=3363906 RepID=UPI0037B7FD3B
MPARFDAIAAEAPVPAVAVSVFDRRKVLAATVRGAGRDDWWDLASLTKVLVTLPEVLDLCPDVSVRLGDVWDRAAGRPIGAATIADLLSHRAGLPATVRFFERLQGYDAIVEAALETGIENRAAAVYSDIGFLLLGALVQHLSGTPLAALAGQRSDLRLGGPGGPAVPTERCPIRHRLIVGEVHDENAWAMGGSSGHAGAFGTLDLVTRAAQWWLNQHSRATECWSTGPDGERYGLGWWLAPTRGLGGPNPGPGGYGHSGFVGNRIWIEPERGYGVVILSNRILRGRGNLEPFRLWCDRLLASVEAWSPR